MLIAFANSLDPECQCADSFCKQFGSRVSSGDQSVKQFGIMLVLIWIQTV